MNHMIKEKEENNGYESTSNNPKWIEKRVPDSYADDDLKRMIIFYVINTPCKNVSVRGISEKEYGWDENIWKGNSRLRNKLYNIAGLVKNDTLGIAKYTNQMKDIFKQIGLKENFYEDISQEKVAIYDAQDNAFLSICFHIRNSFAHGRLAMYENEKKEIVFVMEDVAKIKKRLEVRARMILKKSTLLRWIDIMERKESL